MSATGRCKIVDRHKTPQARYDSNNTTRIAIKLNNHTDADILLKLSQVDNKQGYIKRLIRKDINQ